MRLQKNLHGLSRRPHEHVHSSLLERARRIASTSHLLVSCDTCLFLQETLLSMHVQGAFRDFSLSTCTHWYHRCIIHSHHSCSTRYTLHTQDVPDLANLSGRLVLITKILFLKISRNPTFSVPRNPQSPTLLGSNLGTKSYVLLSLWNLLLSNSCLFNPGYTLSPCFLSLGNTRRVPVTRPPGTTSRSNSPGYPRRGVLPHDGDYPTLTPPLVLSCEYGTGIF